MKKAIFVRSLLGAATASLLVFSSPAQAGYMVTLVQQGSNVVATGSGPIDLTGLTPVLPNPNSFVLPGMIPDLGLIQTGPAPSVIARYSGSSGPTNFGTGSETFASSGSGDFVGLAGVGNSLVVPQGYVSGNPLSDSAIYNNATFSSLGVTPGTYEWT
jgi:hypothetical protein